MLWIQSRGFRFWIISCSPYFWSNHSPRLSILPPSPFSFFLLFVLYFFIFFHHIYLCPSYISLPIIYIFAHHTYLCLDLLFVFFIIIAFILHPRKKIRFPLLLHVLNRRFKKLQIARGSSSFPNHFSSFSFQFSHVEFIFLSVLCNMISYLYIYVESWNLPSWLIISWCRSWIKWIAFFLTWLGVGQDRLLSFVSLILINFYLHQRLLNVRGVTVHPFSSIRSKINPQYSLIY